MKKKYFFTKVLIIFSFLISNGISKEQNPFDKGVELFQKKQFDKSKIFFERDIVFNPKNEKSYLYLAKIFNKQEKKELEEKNLNTVILLNPKNEEATYNLAQLKLKESDYEESKKLVEQLLNFCKDFCQKSQSLKIDIENSIKK